MRIPPWSVAVLVAGVAVGAAGCVDSGPREGELRLGYFPNLTHAQAVYGVSSGLYQAHLGDTRLVPQAFNAGPTAFQALLSGQVDVIYVGPSPTISAIEASGNGAVRIISGSASGGASFVARTGSGIDGPEDLAGRKLASPQLGNTQDVALKHYLHRHGHALRSQGGTVDVINAANPDILVLFQRGDVDGAWLPEPWASRLVAEGGGSVVVDERDLWEGGKFVTTHVVASLRFLQERPDDVRRLVAGHLEATQFLRSRPEEAAARVNEAIGALTGNPLKPETLALAMPQVEFTDDEVMESFRVQYRHAHELGLAHAPPADLGPYYDLRIRDSLRAGGKVS